MVAAAAMLVGVSTSGWSQHLMDDQPELQKIDIVEHLGDTIPFDLAFTDDRGKAVTLGDYFAKDRPVILVLGYYRCPMLCNLVFNGITKALPELGLQPGAEYEVINVSINPEETWELAEAKKRTYVLEAGVSGLNPAWHFLVGPAEQSEQLADAVGFKYFWDEKRNEYAHAAVLIILSPDGMISRYLYGIEFKPKDVRLSLVEASDGKIGTTMDRLILACFHYDPEAGSYVLFARNAMTIGGVLTIFALGLLVGGMVYRERRKRSRAAAPIDADRSPQPPVSSHEV